MSGRDRRKRAWVYATVVVGGLSIASLLSWRAGLLESIWTSKPGKPVAIPTIAAPQAHPAQPAPISATSSLSPTPISLKLVKVFPGRNAREGSALLGPDPSNPQTYAAGALLENGARLVEIHLDRVVLERDGKRAALYLDGRSTGSAADFSSGAAIPAQSTDITTVGGRKAALISQPSSVDSISQAIRAQPLYENEKLSGLQVYPGRSSGEFKQLGLEAGDLIQFIDGQRISKDVQWNEIAEALASGATINVSLTRSGALMHLTLDGLTLVSNRTANTMPPGAPPL